MGYLQVKTPPEMSLDHITKIFFILEKEMWRNIY
jgi:hypothetical protein